MLFWFYKLWQLKSLTDSVSAAPCLGSQVSKSHPRTVGVHLSCASTSSPTTSPAPEEAAGVLVQQGTPRMHQVIPITSCLQAAQPSPPLRAARGAQGCASPGLRALPPGAVAPRTMEVLGCTALCQAHQTPAPKIPSGDDAKGKKRPLLRRDWSSTWQGTGRDRPWNKRCSFRGTRTDQREIPQGTARLKAHSRAVVAWHTLMHSQAGISGGLGATLPAPGSLLPKSVLTWV